MSVISCDLFGLNPFIACVWHVNHIARFGLEFSFGFIFAHKCLRHDISQNMRNNWKWTIRHTRASTKLFNCCSLNSLTSVVSNSSVVSSVDVKVWSTKKKFINKNCFFSRLQKNDSTISIDLLFDRQSHAIDLLRKSNKLKSMNDDTFVHRV